LNDAIGILRKFSIPEPVTGGLLASLVATLLYALSGVGVDFDLGTRDFLLVYFFTTIGINSRVKDLLAGGRPLVILLALTIGYMVLQDFVVSIIHPTPRLRTKSSTPSVLLVLPFGP
jgi:ESS family glutamate:Na+ symporter